MLLAIQHTHAAHLLHTAPHAAHHAAHTCCTLAAHCSSCGTYMLHTCCTPLIMLLMSLLLRAQHCPECEAQALSRHSNEDAEDLTTYRQGIWRQRADHELQSLPGKCPCWVDGWCTLQYGRSALCSSQTSSQWLLLAHPNLQSTPYKQKLSNILTVALAGHMDASDPPMVSILQDELSAQNLHSVRGYVTCSL